MPHNVVPSSVRFYRIKSEDGYNFMAGKTRSGQQILIGVHDKRLVGVFFQPSGDFIRYEERLQPPEEVSRLSSLEAELALWPHLDSWKAEIGFTASDVQVKAFYIPELKVGIADLPSAYQAFLDNPLSFSTQEARDAIREAVGDWQLSDSYILWWRKEYWMNVQGEVTDT
jgi:hypothetical protein